MAKDKRSRRDKLKDQTIEGMQQEIRSLVADTNNHVRQTNFNEGVIKVLEEQIENINKICKKQDETYNKKKPDGKEAK